jgi:hypothetical protein
MDKAPYEGLKRILLRAINRNQHLILSNVDRSSGRMTPTLQELSGIYGIPLSTLKLNARILRDLGLISYPAVSSKTDVELSDLGRFVLSIIEEIPFPGDVQSPEGLQLGLGLPGCHGETGIDRGHLGPASIGGGGEG